MNVLIVGSGKSGVYLAEKLRGKHSVTMIESRPDRAETVAKRMPDVRVVRGDGCEPSVLDRANAGHADLVAALTGDDEDNLVISFLSKTTQNVGLVFARTNHPKNEWLFTKQWGVDVAVSTANIIYSLIEKQVDLGDFVTQLKLCAENRVIDEVTLPRDSSAVGKTLAELSLPRSAHIMAVIAADGEVVVPHGDTVLSAGDEVLILAELGAEAPIRAAFGMRE